MDNLIAKEMYHYQGVKHDCPSVIEQAWRLTRCINQSREITITYYKMSRELVKRRIRPIALIFSEYYYF